VVALFVSLQVFRRPSTTTRTFWFFCRNCRAAVFFKVNFQRVFVRFSVFMYVCFSVFVYVNYDFLLCFLLSLVAFKRIDLHHLPVSSTLFTRSQVPNSNIFL